ncbi:MAG: PIN domain-containing protein [archaeon]|nr:PIN domain-containing protein [archaeon]
MVKTIVLLDTNFILTCVRQKIDFFNEINLMGIKIIIPEEVIGEIKKIKNSEQKLKYREEAEISLKLLGIKKFQTITLNEKKVDTGIVNFAKQNPDAVIATLDRGIKSRISNKKLIIRGKKKLEIMR